MHAMKVLTMTANMASARQPLSASSTYLIAISGLYFEIYTALHLKTQYERQLLPFSPLPPTYFHPTPTLLHPGALAPSPLFDIEISLRSVLINTPFLAGSAARARVCCCRASEFFIRMLEDCI